MPDRQDIFFCGFINWWKKVTSGLEKTEFIHRSVFSIIGMRSFSQSFHSCRLVEKTDLIERSVSSHNLRLLKFLIRVTADAE